MRAGVTLGDMPTLTRLINEKKSADEISKIMNIPTACAQSFIDLKKPKRRTRKTHERSPDM